LFSPSHGAEADFTHLKVRMRDTLIFHDHPPMECA
jgi:hypothetical protein